MTIVIRECLKEDLGAVLRLIQLAFAEQKGVVDPPSSAERKTLEGLVEDFDSGSFALVAEDTKNSEIVACVILKQKEDSLYIGKLSVLPNRRGEGLAFKLMQRAEEIALEKNFRTLLLYVRIMLEEQQVYYQRFGFEQVGFGTHDGYSEATYMIMEKKL